MPDADDFDLDYFRGLMGGGEQKSPETTPGVKSGRKVAPKKPAKSVRAGTRGKGASPTRRKQP